VAVALVGLVATALVGIAGTWAAWLSARDDREAQRRLARDDRTYDRRVSVYSEAIDFVEGQNASWDEYIRGGRTKPGSGTILYYRKRIPHADVPPQRLMTKLRVFGSSQALETFQKTQTLENAIPRGGGCCTKSGEDFILARRTNIRPPPRRFFDAYKPFKAAISRFEKIVHGEVG
jgi:hypothetical protein